MADFCVKQYLLLKWILKNSVSNPGTSHQRYSAPAGLWLEYHAPDRRCSGSIPVGDNFWVLVSVVDYVQFDHNLIWLHLESFTVDFFVKHPWMSSSELTWVWRKWTFICVRCWPVPLKSPSPPTHSLSAFMKARYRAHLFLSLAVAVNSRPPSVLFVYVKILDLWKWKASNFPDMQTRVAWQAARFRAAGTCMGAANV